MAVMRCFGCQLLLNLREEEEEDKLWNLDLLVRELDDNGLLFI